MARALVYSTNDLLVRNQIVVQSAKIYPSSVNAHLLENKVW
jgi:hypothetical protein